jgi:hypothetical protein
MNTPTPRSQHGTPRTSSLKEPELRLSDTSSENLENFIARALRHAERTGFIAPAPQHSVS